MTATVATLDPPEVAAFWKAIGARPADSLPRLVFADWLEEREEKVRCGGCKIIVGKTVCPDCVHWKGRVPKDCRCRGSRRIDCPTCHGTGYVSNGYADLAAALRATADRVPFTSIPMGGPRMGVRHWSWICEGSAEFTDTVPLGILDALGGEIVDGHTNWRDYPTAEAAIRDLVRVWVKLKHQGVSR